MILLRPLDVARVRMLHALGPLSRVLVVSREKRVAAGACVAVGVALVLALGAPIWALALTPLVLGVPHIVADIRYLVVRSGLLRERLVLAAVGAPLLVAALGGGLRAGTIAALAALLTTRGSWRRQVLGVSMLAPVLWIAWRSPTLADTAFAHLHNVVAVMIWWAMRRPRERAGLRWLSLVAIGVAALLVLSGAVTANFRAALPGLDAESLGGALAPGLSAQWAERLVVLYAFGQSIHYAVWLRLVPDEDRARATPRSFSASWAALTADVGPVLVAAAAVSAFVIGWALLVDVRSARDGYLRGAAFHGHLEIVALAYALVRGRLRA